jgi:hypothetical protein
MRVPLFYGKGVFRCSAMGKNLRRKIKKGVWGVLFRLVSVDLKKRRYILWPGRVLAVFQETPYIRGSKSIKKPLEKG